MDYRAQQRFLESYLTKWLIASAILVVTASIALRSVNWATSTFFASYLTIAAALSYLPKYLNLHHEPKKRYGWAVRSRWIIAAMVLSLGAALNLRSAKHLVAVAGCAIWIALVNGFVAVAAKHERMLPYRWMPVVYFASDFWVIGLLGYLGLDPFYLSGFIALAIVFAVVLNENLGPWFAMLCMVLGAALVRTAILPTAYGFSSAYLVLCIALVTAATSWLSNVAVGQAQRNEEDVIAELAGFTSMSPAKARSELVEAHPRVGQAWKAAKLDENDKEALAKFYSEHSLEYLFALAQFHLSYKHIAFTLDVIKLCRGRVLDYGAGKGSLAIELAKRGMAVTYLDVPGRSRDYAEWQATRENTKLEFTASKEEIAGRQYDTIVSLDVLEHLPDLAGELRFLIALLAPQGRLVLTIPEGATETQPMHLSHDLSALRILDEAGLKDIKSGLMKLAGSEILRKSHCVVMQKG
jgi:2-polyprenyl-3-methyl-5-hydroxy-6-metoxy-1,4-benzoquinol methylase